MILLFLWIVFVLGVAVYHYYLIEVRQERPNYFLWFVIKAMAAIIHGIFFDPYGPEDYVTWLPVLIFQVTSFWVIFSPVLNLMRGLSFWYLGKNSGWIDKFFLKYSALYKVVYFIVMIIFLVTLKMISEW